jgi:putative hydrolase of the HAD superfamily
MSDDFRIRAVYFDAVGTVILPAPSAHLVYAEVARRMGHAVDSNAIRERLWAAFQREEAEDRLAQWRTSEDRERQRWSRIVDASLPEVGASCFGELFQHFGQGRAWQVIDGATEAFEGLRQLSLPLGLASNYDGRLESVVAERPELAPLRERLVISSRVGFRKPAPEFFAEVIRQADCNPQEILFVGDDLENDFLGAQAAGLQPLLFDPAKRHPDIHPQLARLQDLPQWVASQRHE